MASNKSPGRSIPGIRGSIPSGYLLGRAARGEGDVELLTLKKLQAVGLSPTSLPGPPTGLAGGDLTGSYPDPVVRALRGRNVSNVAPSDKNVLAWDNAGTAWAPLMLGAVAYTSAYADLTGAPAIHNIPAGGTVGQALTKIDGTDYNVQWSSVAGGSGGGAASIQDDGTNIYIAISDTDGQLVLDGSGDPVFMLEIFPKNAIPAITPPTSQTFSAAGAFTWNRPTGCTRIEIAVKAGGGGSNSQGGGNPGGTGGDSNFDIYIAKGGSGGNSSGTGTPGVGGSGGTPAVGVSGVIQRLSGDGGSPPVMTIWSSTTFIMLGGKGGGIAPAPPGGTAGGGSGTAGFANTGGGASGANTANLSQASLAGVSWSAGGGEGEFLFANLNNPASTYNGSVGDGGAAGNGAGTTFTGAKGGSGIVIIREFYGD